MRDDFTQPTVQLLAKRVGFRCSNPDCRKPTSGPGADGGAVSLGVAAHITGASPGGARFNPHLKEEGRRAAENGIWLCQQCGRLVDADHSAHSVTDLLTWKEFAEAAAKVELRGYVVRRGRDFATLESKMPALIAEMREDMASNPLVRELIALSPREVYISGPTPNFTYRTGAHPDLMAKLQICQNYGAIVDATYNAVPRFNFTEDFADYLLAPSSGAGG